MSRAVYFFVHRFVCEGVFVFCDRFCSTDSAVFKTKYVSLNLSFWARTPHILTCISSSCVPLIFVCGRAFELFFVNIVVSMFFLVNIVVLYVWRR